MESDKSIAFFLNRHLPHLLGKMRKDLRCKPISFNLLRVQFHHGHRILLMLLIVAVIARIASLY